MLRSIKPRTWTYIIVAAFILLRLPSLFEPYWYGDEGIYLTIGQALRKGLTLFTQIHDNKPPTLYYLAAIAHTVFGFRLLLAASIFLASYVFKKLLKRFFSTSETNFLTLIFVVFTSIPLLEGNIANAEVFMLLPTILSMIFVLSEKKLVQLFLAGLLFGFAFTIKVPVAAELFFVCFWLLLKEFDFSLLNSPKKIKEVFLKESILVIGFLIPTVFWAIYFVIKKALPQFIFAALLQNFGYLSSWVSGSHQSSPTEGGLVYRLLLLLFVFLLLFLAVFKKKLDSKHSFVFFWFISALFGALLSGRPYPHYLIQVVPSLVMIIGLFLFKNNLVSRIFPLISLLLLAAALVKYKFYYYPVFAYYRNFYSYALTLKSKAEYQKFFGDRVSLNYELSKYLKLNTKPSDTIFVWGDEPYVYALSDRLPPGRYTVAYHVVDFKAHQETISAIKSKMPKFIVVYPMDNRPFIELDNFISKYYYLTKDFNSIFVYRLR